jgi:hypothetical protein
MAGFLYRSSVKMEAVGHLKGFFRTFKRSKYSWFEIKGNFLYWYSKKDADKAQDEIEIHNIDEL